jgi:MoaA/NifB/PqqE/SkfB family radical SAM enzyme
MNINVYLNNGINRIIKTSFRIAFPNIKECFFIAKYARRSRCAKKIRRNFLKNGEHIPPFLIASIGDQCNLHCKGCYARANYSKMTGNVLPVLSCEKWEMIFREAESIGIGFILLAGGEPLMRKDVVKMAGKMQNILFPIFTNGTMVNSDYINIFNECRNLFPVFSIEGRENITDIRRGKGVYENFLQNANSLKRRKILFGVSITVTQENINEVTSDDFINYLYGKGCKILFFVEYVECDKTSDGNSLDDETRNYLKNRLLILHGKYNDILLISFPGDEAEMDGCLAAGRGFFHINPYGGVEPCPFSPYSDTNLVNSTLREALNSRLFKSIQESSVLNGKHKGSCVLFEKEDIILSLIKNQSG